MAHMVSIMLLNISTIRGEWHPTAQFNDPDEDHPFHLIDGQDERALKCNMSGPFSN